MRKLLFKRLDKIILSLFILLCSCNSINKNGNDLINFYTQYYRSRDTTTAYWEKVSIYTYKVTYCDGDKFDINSINLIDTVYTSGDVLEEIPLNTNVNKGESYEFSTHRGSYRGTVICLEKLNKYRTYDYLSDSTYIYKIDYSEGVNTFMPDKVIYYDLKHKIILKEVWLNENHRDSTIKMELFVQLPPTFDE
ncbi:hypothetical protein [Sediminitomix flava]|uniref:Lipoprotein n=1 Tax=Sediminitomix flava TaxID=379075 RepID=A0A315Z6L6_SEDFL|nr:hypothetical protein [Sediminitomix flava]PWJ38011.1 hypothetical protein BC781_108146 [Sediminitomix flava]